MRKNLAGVVRRAGFGGGKNSRAEEGLDHAGLDLIGEEEHLVGFRVKKTRPLDEQICGGGEDMDGAGIFGHLLVGSVINDAFRGLREDLHLVGLAVADAPQFKVLDENQSAGKRVCLAAVEQGVNDFALRSVPVMGVEDTRGSIASGRPLRARQAGREREQNKREKEEGKEIPSSGARQLMGDPHGGKF